jgi:hypothetical protein
MFISSSISIQFHVIVCVDCTLLPLNWFNLYITFFILSFPLPHTVCSEEQGSSKLRLEYKLIFWHWTCQYFFLCWLLKLYAYKNRSTYVFCNGALSKPVLSDSGISTPVVVNVVQLRPRPPPPCLLSVLSLWSVLLSHWQKFRQIWIGKYAQKLKNAEIYSHCS